MELHYKVFCALNLQKMLLLLLLTLATVFDDPLELDLLEKNYGKQIRNIMPGADKYV